MARRSPEDDPAGLTLSANYTYDSRLNVALNPQPQTANQLPPTVQLTVVALDETSAVRLCRTSTPPAEITAALKDLFLNPANYAADLASLESSLAALNVKFRTFTLTVPIRESKME